MDSKLLLIYLSKWCNFVSPNIKKYGNVLLIFLCGFETPDPHFEQVPVTNSGWRRRRWALWLVATSCVTWSAASQTTCGSSGTVYRPNLASLLALYRLASLLDNTLNIKCPTFKIILKDRATVWNLRRSAEKSLDPDQANYLDPGGEGLADWDTGPLVLRSHLPGIR